MGNYPRTGLRLRSEAGVHPVVRSVSIKFCKWLRTQMEFCSRRHLSQKRLSNQESYDKTNGYSNLFGSL